LKILTIILLFVGVPVYGQIGFQENKGQFDSPIDFRANYGSHVIFLDQEGFSVLLYNQQTWGDVVTHLHDHHTRDIADSFVFPAKLEMQHIKYEFVGANLEQYAGTSKQTAYYNYFLGDDPSRWAGKVASYSKVLYKNIYPNIDLEYVCIDKRFKYNFILNRGSNIEDIQLKIVGASQMNPHFIFNSLNSIQYFILKKEPREAYTLPNVLFIPNAFTPNKDGNNEWFPYSAEVKQPAFVVCVYSRWGEKIFDSQEQGTTKWDGQYKGELVPAGVYVYLVTYRGCDGNTRTDKGMLHAIY
jgi:gliding motility-associated-like protein